MAPAAFAVRLLTLALFLFMNGQGISARDLKVEQQDQKQVHSNGAILVSSDEPYIDFNEPTIDTHDSNEPYITGYKTTTSVGTLEANHRTGTREANEPYITGYRTTTPPGTREANEPYITGYRTTTPPGTREANEPYITGYRTTTPHGTHEANEPYITGYRTTTPHGTHEANEPYITGYRTTTPPGTREANEPYITGYRTTTPHGIHEANEPYITGYRTTTTPGTRKANQPTYSASYRTGTHDSNEPYITQYGNKIPKHGPKESTSAQDSGEQYKTQYGNRIPEHGPKVSAQGYKASYKKKSKNVDHTEAFKTGFFALEDLYAGNVMTLRFPVQGISHFISRKEADSIPFSTSQLPSVLQLFSIPEDSPKGKAMRGTLEQCEGEPMTGERKTCAKSLESMLEFVDSVLGSNTEYDLLTTSYPTPSGSLLQKYTILEVSKDIDAPKWAACHPLPYPYAVYYCHYISTGTKVFKVSLGGENGERVEALGVCHLDTSDWNPSHIIFKQLGIEAGKGPVCHFFPVKHLMWVPQPSKVTM